MVNGNHTILIDKVASASIKESSIGKNVREEIFKTELSNILASAKQGKDVEERFKRGLDYLIKCTEKGENLGNVLCEYMAEAYNKRYGWATDYQLKVIYAMKEGKLKQEKVA